MKVQTWITDTQTYHYNQTLYYDITDNTIVLTSIPIDLNTYNISFKSINKYSIIMDNLLNHTFNPNSSSNFATYDYANNVQWLGYISNVADDHKYNYLYEYYTLLDLIDDNLNITNVVNYNNIDYIFSQQNYYYKIDKSNSNYYTFKAISTNHDQKNPIKYKDLVFYNGTNYFIKFDLTDESMTHIFNGNSQQTLYIDDNIIVITQDSKIICISYTDNTTVYSADLLDDDQLKNYNNSTTSFIYVLKSRTATDLELELILTLPETNPDDNVEYQVPHIFTVLIKDYKTSDQSVTLTESTVDFGNFNKYLVKASDYIYTHIITEVNHKYLVFIYHSELLTFTWDEADTKYIMIDYTKVSGDNVYPVWNNQLELCEYNKFDPDGTHVTFLTFNGTSWEFNRPVYTKSNIVLNDDELYYLSNDDKLVVDKYKTKPSASIKFDKAKYVYVENKVIHTGITINSYYYLPETTIRYAVQILTDNAHFATNNSNSFEIEMQAGEYPLKIDITGYDNVELNLNLLGAWILDDGASRSFKRKSTIEYSHKHTSNRS